MDILTNKRFESYDYNCRYTAVPYYYNTVDQKDIYGIGSNVFKNTPWVAHKVTSQDNLDKLALKYYGNPTYWWIIAYYNDIQDAFINLSTYYQILKIPTISKLEFGAER